METNKKTAFLDSSPKVMLKLKPNTSPVWGTMTAQHMVEHLSSALLMSIKNTTDIVKTSGEIILRNKMNMLTNGFKPGISMGYAKLKTLKYSDLASAINQYSMNLKNFSEAISTTNLLTSHFYFGPLKNEEWLTFHYWHIHHHFKQFNIL